MTTRFPRVTQFIVRHSIAHNRDVHSIPPGAESKLLIPLALILLLSIVSLAGLGTKLIRDERQVLRTQYRELHAARIRDYRDQISQALDELRERLHKTSLSVYEPGQLRDSSLHSRHIDSVFFLDSTLSPLKGLEAIDSDFWERTHSLWPTLPALEESLDPEGSWLTYYWRDGLHVALLFPTPAILGSPEKVEAYRGFDLNRSSLYADLIASLPFTTESQRMAPGTRVELLNEHGVVLYGWGSERVESPYEMVVGHLQPPLQALQLRYLVPRRLWDRPFYSSAFLIVFPGVGLCIAALAVLSFYFYREHTRELRNAAERVTFVNQVSHELKTPLTNIRMYAELVQEHLDAESTGCAHHVRVIRSESERLGRLINSILCFNQHRHSGITLNRAPGSIPLLLDTVIEQCSLSLRERGISVLRRYVSSRAPEVMVDSDIFLQIVTNLVSNVEKYAAAGSLLGFSYSFDDDFSEVLVWDKGPGIPEELHEKIFEPFFRCSNATTEGSCGTGIGLSIARELARLHGGDLSVRPSTSGALFHLRLHTPLHSADTFGDT